MKLRISAVLLLTASLLPALNVNLTDMAPTYSAFFPGPCRGPGGPWPGCGATGYLSFSNTEKPTDSFVNFDSFNSSQAAGLGDMNFQTAFQTFDNGWTLNEQPAIANLTYNITQFQTTAGATTGGVNIQIAVTPGMGYNGPDLSTLVWSQALLINYSVTDASAFFDPPNNVMDDYSFSMGAAGAFSKPCTPIPASPDKNTPSTIPANPAGTAYCDPIYPFQDGSNGFSDAPRGGYPKDSFRAEAFLTSVNTVTKTLTVYDGGVNYGFDLYVAPEPGTWAMGTVGVLILAILRRRSQPGARGSREERLTEAAN
jgi:hypothetical protein